MSQRLGLLFSALLTVSLLSGCASVMPEEKPILLDITFAELEKNINKALDPGGVKAEQRSYRQRMIVSRDQVLDDPTEELVEVTYSYPDDLRMASFDDSDSASTPSLVWIIRKNAGWLVDYKRKSVKQLSPEQLRLMRRTFTLDSPARDLSGTYSKIELTACEMDGRPYYKMECTPKAAGRAPVYIYVGKHDFLIRWVRTEFEIGGSEIDYVSNIRLYKLYDGVMIPSETVSVMNGDRSVSRVESYEELKSVDPAEFMPPVFK
ncbi:MAG: hypothetical protein PHI35_03975 [Victivallaceae bacterium]|nr:hypothetical protein [Victivallaceae bacterium]